MSDRERWIVYPLLFLAVGMSVITRASLDEEREAHKPTDLNVIRCKGLEVLGADGKPRWALGTTTAGEGVLELTNNEQKLAAQLVNNSTGAMLTLYNRTGENTLYLGYKDQLVFLANTDQTIPQSRQIFAFPILPPPAQEPAPQKIEPETPAAPESAGKKSDG
jgi:hypothetical protein